MQLQNTSSELQNGQILILKPNRLVPDTLSNNLKSVKRKSKTEELKKKHKKIVGDFYYLIAALNNRLLNSKI